MDKAKPFCISKREVWEAYKRVKANHGAAGVDGQSIAEFEEDLKNNLYKLWNRMTSGSYFPRLCDGWRYPRTMAVGSRLLGIPTVADRIAQTVVKDYLEPILDACFHPDSYGYRPQKSAKEALAMARARCWRYDWVLELDIRAFFDNLSHELAATGATPSHRLQVGTVVRRAVVEGARAVGRRELGGSGQRDASRRCCESAVEQSLFALCVRSVDAQALP